MQRYKEYGIANITLSHFILVVDYQRFKLIEGNVINNKKERQSLTSLSQLVRNTYMFNYYFLLLFM